VGAQHLSWCPFFIFYSMPPVEKVFQPLGIKENSFSGENTEVFSISTEAVSFGTRYGTKLERSHARIEVYFQERNHYQFSFLRSVFQI
jgi:hypothetical protein